MLVVPLILIAGGVGYWISLQGKVSTDNAYIKQDKVSISPLVGGTITGVYVKENDLVSAGQLLFRIDPEPYRIQLQQADASIATAQADLTALASDPALTGADIAAAREDIAYAQSLFDRQKALMARGFTTKADYDAAEHQLQQGREQLRLALAQQAEAKSKLAHGAAVPGENPRIAAAQAQRASARLSLSRTEIRAPMAGRVAGSTRLQLGQQAIAELPMFTLVGVEGTYVEANFKETDLDDMKVGQPVKITFDAYPELKIRGHVSSIGSGTASEFSVLPAQNASGNWVKVTQRVPVRIAIDEKSPRALIAGLSAHVTVYTDGRKN